MKKYILCFVLYLITASRLWAQTLSPEATPAAGGYFNAGGNSLSWTMGETYNTTLISGTTWVSQGEQQPEIDILTGPIAPSMCAGSSVVIPYVSKGYYGSGNVFTAQLSDAAGSFAVPVNIGSLASIVSGNISCNIPLGISGASYRIRVVSNLPAYNGLSVIVTINPVPVVAVTVSPSATVCAATLVTLSGTGATSYSWSGGITDGVAFIANTTTIYTVTGTSSGCSATAAQTVTVNSCGAITWTGTVGTAWNTPGNWSNGLVPNSCATDITIPPVANQPTISTAVSIGNITLLDGAILTLNANLSVCGNWTGGTVSASTVIGNSFVVLTGGSVQQLSGRTLFQTLRLNNPAGATMQPNSFFDIFTALELQSGPFTVGTGTLTFKSPTAASSAVLDNFTSGFTGTFSGTASGERGYSTPAGASYSQHFMSSPFNNTSFAQFAASGTGGFVTPTVNCDETQLAGGSAYGTVFSARESNGATCAEAQWFVEIAGNATNGQGYSVKRSGAGVITLTGTPNLNPSYTRSGLANSNWNNTSLQAHPFSSGWVMFGNPYLATLKLTTVNAGFDNQIQIWNALTGSYISTTVGSPTAVIPPFGAWLAHITNPGAGNSYTINAGDRVRQVVQYYALNNNSELGITSTLAGSTVADYTSVAFNPNATNQFDAQYDANKLSGTVGRHNLYTLCNNHWMSINTLQSIAQTSTVPMGFDAQTNGTYTLNFNGLNTFDETSYITLEDTKLNVFHDVRSGDYTFTSSTSDNWNRFVLHFTPAAVINTADATCATTGSINVQQPGTASWSYILTDIYSTTISSGMLNQSAPMTVNVPAGNYTLTLVDNNNYTVIKNVIVNGNQSVVAAFNASANTVQQNDNVTFTCTTPNATVFAWNFGDGTVANTQTAIHSFANPATYTVALTVLDGSGCQSTISQTVTVTHRNATGINNITDSKLSIWSSDNTVYVDFSKESKVDATIDIYNVLGQQISSEKFSTSTVYSKQFSNIDAAYMMIRVKNGEEVITKKVFLANNK